MTEDNSEERQVRITCPCITMGERRGFAQPDTNQSHTARAVNAPLNVGIYLMGWQSRHDGSEKLFRMWITCRRWIDFIWLCLIRKGYQNVELMFN